MAEPPDWPLAQMMALPTARRLQEQRALPWPPRDDPFEATKMAHLTRFGARLQDAENTRGDG